jgi:RND family efflux transporter MFP subunit
MTGSMQRRIGIALTALLLPLLAGCHDDAADISEPVRPVLFATVAPMTTHMFGPFAGTIEPRYKSDLAFQTTGRLVARDVSVGDVVHKGDRLAALDATVLQFALVQTKADIDIAAARLANAETMETRDRALVQRGSAAQATLDAAVADKEAAAASLRQAHAAFDKAKDQLGYAELHADFDGIITSWSADIGQIVTEGSSIASIARPDVREAVVDIPSDLIGEVQAESALTVTLQGAPGVTAIGHVREIAPSADASTRSRRMRLSLDSPPEAFRLGSTVTVASTSVTEPWFELPATALLERDGKTSVWIVPPDTNAVVLRDVTVSGRHDGMIVVSKGIAGGERVVTAGVHELKAGQVVKLLTPLSQSRGASAANLRSAL